MKGILLFFLLSITLFSCKEDVKMALPETQNNMENTLKNIRDSIIELPKDTIVVAKPKTRQQIKEELKLKGFKTYDYIDKETNDTILVQQYFMAILKRGSIRGLNEEEEEELQEFYMRHLKKMYRLGYADIAGAFGDDGSYGGVTVYNVPTLKIADSLARSNPMVASGRLEIEIHPWWAPKGFYLR